MKLPATVLPSVPCPLIQMPANVLPLSRFGSLKSLCAIAGRPDQVVAGSAVDRDSGFVWQGESTGRIGAQEAAIDPVAGGGGPVMWMPAPAGAEIVDIEPAHGDIRTGDQQTVARPGLAAAELDEWSAGIARLGGAVDQDRTGDRRQGEGWRDRLHALARDIEVDRARAAGGRIRVEDRLAQRAGTAVRRRAHDVNAIGALQLSVKR